jgi:predicted RNA methylase
MANISQHRRTFGQFFTPQAVVACCYALVAAELPGAPRIVDPACGDGAFLTYAAERAIGAPDQLVGCDLDPALIAGLAASGLTGARVADGLDPASLPDGAFDLVIGNPPFGVATSANGSAALASEARFLIRAVELARAGGLIALVLPSGVLSNERLRTLRAGLLERCTILASIDLPRDTFRHAGTSAACGILLLRKAAAPAGHRVFFALPRHLASLPAVASAYRRGSHGGEPPYPAGRGASEGDTWFWLPQSLQLASRLAAGFWRPEHRALLERLLVRQPLRPLGELVELRRSPLRPSEASAARGDLIAGDHVRPSRGEAKGPGLPYEYYQTREFMPAGYNFAAIERCDERAYQRLRRTAVLQHDILVSCAGVGGAGRGRVCLVTHRPGPSCTGDVFILRVARPDPIYLFLFLASAAGRAQLVRLQNGVGTSNLSADELLQVEVPLPPEAAQRDLAARYAPIAATHEAAVAALARGDGATFEGQRASAEAGLTALIAQVEALVLGPI